MREFFRRPPGNHVVGLLDYGALRARDLRGHPVADCGHGGDVSSGRDHEARHGNLTEASCGGIVPLARVVPVRCDRVLDELRP